MNVSAEEILSQPEIEAWLVEIESLGVLGLARPDFRVALHALPNELDFDGVLGLDFLRNHRVILDFPADEMGLV